MSKKKIETPVSAEVLIHNYGKNPSDETKSKIMEFIDSHKEETMALTPETFPAPDAEHKQSPSSQRDDTSSSGGELAEDC